MEITDFLIRLFSLEIVEMVFRLMLAVVLGMFLGAERHIVAEKSAGMRTYALVAMGAALFIIIGSVMFETLGSGAGIDPLRVMAQIVVGLGFIGAGIIIFREKRLRGLTPAAGIWVAGAIGIAVGFGLYTIAIAATILTFLIFTAMRALERELKQAYGHLTGEEGDEEGEID